MPKLSIITINYNNTEGLRKTIESVVSQTFADYEYIVIDGGSTDDSISVINEFADKITYWVSEPDKGIYNAMNKGILNANGEYLLFLNSGDWFVDEEVVGDFCRSDFKDDIVSGNQLLLSNENGPILKIAAKENDISYDFFIENVIWHQSTFIKKELFVRVGLYSEFYLIVSDWEFFIKALILHQCSYTSYDRNIAFFECGGISEQAEWLEIQLAEREKVFRSLGRLHGLYINYSRRINLLENELNEFRYLKDGSFGFLIRLIIWLKKKYKIIRWK
jgi:Glycosyltransferases involved in cell wall biogenesis